jgi:thiamine-phosphate pyrophosphorylase
MDQRLVAWARAVKARRRGLAPPLWLFTDPARLEDVLGLARALPQGLCGIVFRHDGAPDRAALGRALARICKARRISLSVAADWRLAVSLGAGFHIRMSRRERAKKCHRIVTASAHGPADAARAARAGATLVFISPVFETASHPGAAPLGAVKFASISKRCRLPCLALGGVTGISARRLTGAFCAGAGGIGAFSPIMHGRVERVTPH